MDNDPKEPKTMNLPDEVYKDCKKLLDPKYKWLTHRYQTEYPPFKLPDNPTEDIRKALSWLDTVNSESKGTDPGDDFRAANFRDEGTKVYRSNINVLTYLIDHKDPCVQNVLDQEVKLAVERWTELERSCHECRNMMRKLHYNYR
jgi:hypothetical protein